MRWMRISCLRAISTRIVPPARTSSEAGNMSEPSPPRLDITSHWPTVQRDILRIVELVPDDKIDWSPKPELWNFRGILIHVSDARDIWMSRDVQDGEPYPNIWATARTKDDLRRELERSWQRLNRFLADQSQLDKTYTAEREGKTETFTGHFIAFHLLEHDVHHRAELMQRLALLGIEHAIDL
jgi:uncharacterized damage-inducible protein DinB